MSDFDLTALPLAPVRLRVGYSRNVSEGPSFSSFHEGTDALIFQQWKTTLNSYRVGIDLAVLPRTRISYDQFWHEYKGDTSWLDQNFAYRLADGTPVDLGIVFNTPARQPCSAPIVDSGTDPPTAEATCNGFLEYRRSGPVRTSYPTEQLSFQSRYFGQVDIAGRLSYSSSDSETSSLDELFRGRASRTNLRQLATSGSTRSKRVSVASDLAATWRVTEKFRVMNMFHLSDFRIPGQWLFSESSLFGPSMLIPPNLFDPATCQPPSDVSGCPEHTNSSPADIISGSFSLFLGQKDRSNQFELQYDFLQSLSGKLGYRFRHRLITFREEEDVQATYLPTLPNRGACAGQPLQPDGSCQIFPSDVRSDETEINEHSLLLGVQARPMETLRLNLDLELMSADNAFTRISPRHRQHYKLRIRFRPVPWMSLSTSVNILENRHNVPDIENLQHNRSYAFSASMEPTENLEFELGYDYNDVFSQTNICFVGSVQPPGSTQCPTAARLSEQISLYENRAHFGYGNLVWRLASRVSTKIGYAVVSTSGNTLILSPNALPGTLQYNYHKPYAGLTVNLATGLTWGTSWGYYGYNEKSPATLGIAARDFRGNLVTASVRYSF
jgi:hypothetical protein